MIKARTVFDGEADKRAYVLSCEAGYEAALDGAVRRVLAIPDCRTVLLSGPTCSGKTTTAKKLITEFSEAGARVRVVSIDDFFYDRALLIERAVATGGRIDFDSPSTIDMEALAEAVDDILSGRPARLPRFDFLSGRRCETVTVPHGEHDVYIFEGIQAIYPTVTALFAGHRCASVFAFAERGIALADTAFDRTELRLLRRLVRDYNFRGADPTFTLDLWESVRENEEKNILPYIGTQDVVIDSTLGYELSALKPFLLPLLSRIPEEHSFYSEARRIASTLSRIDEISKSYIPATSVYREFLG
ncbi:MAG: Flp pilus assembly complex ATPase component TadA [Clostridia bacterium]|nr:Flp pilus assembly complex ATPase component TadA [Clostridia bacterium]